MEITRSGILRDCLEEKNREMHRYSKHGAGLLPLEGYEQHFEDLQVTCNLLRDMILKAEAREDEVRPQRTAQWQKDLMAGMRPRMITREEFDRKMEDLQGEYDKQKKLPSEGKDYVWNPVTQTWDDPKHGNPNFIYTQNPITMEWEVYEYRPKHVKTEPVVYPGGES